MTPYTVAKIRFVLILAGWVLFAAIVLSALSGCAPDTMTRSPSQPANETQLTATVYRIHDIEAQVTCWIIDNVNGRGISCIPDDDFRGKTK